MNLLETHKTMAIIAFGILCLPITLVLFPDDTHSSESTHAWNFDDHPVGKLPEQFQIGTLYDGRVAGDWTIVEVKHTPSPPHALGQLMGKGAEHAYKVVLVNGTESADVDLRVSFFAVSGKGDMGGGLVWRAQDDRNYYLTRANPLEQNIRIYHVVKGVRKMLLNFDQMIDAKTWHRLRVKAQGCQMQVFYDDHPVFTLCDRTFTTGRIGLWTKSDAVTYFDDLQATITK